MPHVIALAATMMSIAISKIDDFRKERLIAEAEAAKHKTCGQWIGSSGQRAYICNDCSWGSKKDGMIVCIV